ncbi:MAG: DUF559 domain-containing protein [Propionibacteriaceae bacterium]|nr:DUF559 domain-containing protein [Propionibacteriaceae bacterium]
MAESLVHRGILRQAEVFAILQGVSARVDDVLTRMDRAESGTETLVRLRLRSKGIKVHPQVFIPTVGRVDFLIGVSLVLEVDSVAHHFDPADQEADMVRDQKLVALGYRVIRISYSQIMFDWPAVESRIMRIVRAGLHRRRLCADGQPDLRWETM